MRVLVAIVCGLTFGAQISLANAKTLREFKSGKVAPAVKEAEEGFKKSCGCALKISLDATLVNEEDLSQAKRVAENITSGAAGHCTDAESKKAMCKLKTVAISKGKEVKVDFKGSTAAVHVTEQSYASFDMIADQVDK